MPQSQEEQVKLKDHYYKKKKKKAVQAKQMLNIQMLTVKSAEQLLGR